MEGTNLYPYRDGDANHDHTYYGYGCPNIEAASTISCNLRTTDSYDGETQSIGTYYNYPSGTSGSGTMAVTDNSNAPDTFCPLGWQVPYGGTDGDYYDQSKSWRYLFNTYNYKFNADAFKILSYPISIVRSGRFYTLVGGLFSVDDVANVMSKTASSDFQNYRVDVRAYNKDFSYAVDKNSAYSIRCSYRLASWKCFP